MVAKRLETEVSVKFPAAVKIRVLKYVENDGGSAHLVGNTAAARHGINKEGRAKPFALHVAAYSNRTNVDHGNVRYTGALPS